MTDTPNTNEELAPAPTPEAFEEVQRQRDSYLEQLQRERAEFANFQKRSRAQAEIDRQYAVGMLAGDLLGALDDLERAIAAAQGAGKPTIVEGLDLVQKHFLAALAKHGVEPIVALGGAFDPNFHEALRQQPDPTHPENTVVAELSRGYRLRDRVLRPARVVVSVQP